MLSHSKDKEEFDCVTTAIHANDYSWQHTNMLNYPKDMEDLDYATIAIPAVDHSQLHLHMTNLNCHGA